MFAKRFFYVCAGLLCLAFAYHLGSAGAAAQGGSIFEGCTVTGDGRFTGALSRTVYRYAGGVGYAAYAQLIPGSASVTAVVEGYALLENGDMYQWSTSDPGFGQWQYVGNLAGAPTPAQPATFGSVKARWR